jgi:hypothetical protein
MLIGNVLAVADGLTQIFALRAFTRLLDALVHIVTRSAQVFYHAHECCIIHFTFFSHTFLQSSWNYFCKISRMLHYTLYFFFSHLFAVLLELLLQNLRPTGHCVRKASRVRRHPHLRVLYFSDFSVLLAQPPHPNCFIGMCSGRNGSFLLQLAV